MCRWPSRSFTLTMSTPASRSRVAVVARREWGVKTDRLTVEPSGSCSSFQPPGSWPRYASTARHIVHGLIAEVPSFSLRELRCVRKRGPGKAGLLYILGDCLGGLEMQ